jgi:hypothetical protein
MRFLKTYELYTGNNVDYSVGDIVVCADDKIKGIKTTSLKEGDKYNVLKIYSNPEDKFLKTPFLRVDVENIETGEISKGWDSNRFKLEFEFDAGKYNI